MNKPRSTMRSRLGAWLLAAAALALNACGGGGAATTPSVNVPVAAAADYAGPAPATADVQSFKINFWENVRSSNRCGQCHNATSPAQMPNFARSDDVNLAYAQANTVVNLSTPALSTVVTKVAGGHNCWLSDPSACASILTQWITAWAGATAGTTTQVQLIAPAIKDVGGSKNFPGDPTGFQTNVYTPYLVPHCSKCHSPTAAVPQSPYFAAADINAAYTAAIPKMDLNTPANSRFVVRLRDESHNCWSGNCANDAADMLAAITAYANSIPVTNVDPQLVISKAVNMLGGTIASGASRFDANVIAKYEFQTGSGTTAFDTSGVDPGADLTLTNGTAWVGGWGLSFAPGFKAQASTGTSKKIHDMILATGEFSVEAWVAPSNVTQTPAYIVSYSGGDTQRNFTLSQGKQDYVMNLRTSGSDANGVPVLSTSDSAMLVQASLQHVVVTYDPVNGRRMYVNGVFTGNVDSQTGGTLTNWDDTFALVLGSEVSADRAFTGVIKLVAIHNRALTAAQVQQNFAAGVGQRYYVLFNVESVTGVSQSYVVFQVSVNDTYSYLFNKPVFVSLDPNAKPNGIVIKGIRIGVNGVIGNVGQAYIPLSTTVTTSSYYPGQGQALSSIGTVIPVSQGPQTDFFFLSFDQLGTQTHVVSDTAVLTPAPAVNGPVAADLGIRTFDRMNQSMAAITSVPTTNANVNSTYLLVQQQLPTAPTLEGFLPAHQVAVAQLAIQYCSEMVNDPTKSAGIFPGMNFTSGSVFSTQAGRNQVITPLVNLVLGTNLTTQDYAGMTTELNNLMTNLQCGNGSSCSGSREQAVTKAVCAAAIGSAGVMLN